MSFSWQATTLISILSAVISGLILFTSKDYITSFKFKKEDFLTKKEFDEHRKNCCAIGLKKDFILHKNETTKSTATLDTEIHSVKEIFGNQITNIRYAVKSQMDDVKVSINQFHKETEKQFDQGRKDFQMLRDDISELNRTVAAMGATLKGIENKVSSMK